MDYAIIVLQLSFVHLKIETSKTPGPKNSLFHFFFFVYSLFKKEMTR